MCIYPGNSNSQRGFTLIEVLSSMVILALVLTAASMALSQFSRINERLGVRSQEAIDSVLRFNRLNYVLQQTQYYALKDNKEAPFFYFEGKQDEMQFFSSASLQKDSQTTFAKLHVRVNQVHPELYDLVLSEFEITDAPIIYPAGLPRESEMQQQLMIEGAQDIKFSFLGIQNIRQMLLANDSENYLRTLAWADNYSATRTTFLPIKIKVEITWPDGTKWPCIISVKKQNFALQNFIIDGL